MQLISFKKILAVIMAIVFLSQLHHVIRAFSILSEAIYKSLAPYRQCPEEIKYVINVAVFVLVFVFLWKVWISNRD
ncbi:MAG: hypothetical protein ABFD79_06250 [Phycisphaerales bacterium]